MLRNNIFRASRLPGSRQLGTLLSNDAFRVLLSSGTGRLGLLFFLILVGVSLYVVAVFPLDFGLKQWNNPPVWAASGDCALVVQERAARLVQLF